MASRSVGDGSWLRRAAKAITAKRNSRTSGNGSRATNLSHREAILNCIGAATRRPALPFLGELIPRVRGTCRQSPLADATVKRQWHPCLGKVEWHCLARRSYRLELLCRKAVRVQGSPRPLFCSPTCEAFVTTKGEMFAGLTVAIITPFKDGEVDYAGLRKLVDWHVEQGTDCLAPVGTTGEAPTLSHDEHERVIAAVVDASAGRIKVMPGTGSNSTREAIRLTRFAQAQAPMAPSWSAPITTSPLRRAISAISWPWPRPWICPLSFTTFPGAPGRTCCRKRWLDWPRRRTLSRSRKPLARWIRLRRSRPCASSPF